MGEEAEDSVLLSLLNVTATVTTILMFLTGVTPCREVPNRCTMRCEYNLKFFREQDKLIKNLS